MKERLITLSGEDYLICNDLVVDGENYLYVVSLDGKRHSILNRKIENGEDTVESVADEALIKKIFGIIANKENN